MNKWMVPLALVLTFANGAHAEIHTEVVSYSHGDTPLEGYLAYEKEHAGRLPAVLVIHEWTGLGDFVRGRVEQLAREGLAAFGVDVYGKGIRPETTEEAAEQAGIYRADRALMRARAQAGLEELLSREIVDPARIAAIGYCFGGGVALELARSGAEIAGVVSFHGNLDTPDPKDAEQIKAKILVCHGADDPYVPGEQVAAFIEEMRAANVDWQMISYGGAVHSFTNPGAGEDNSRGAAYNESADRRSWRAMKAFFEEVLE
jgi:dienelactone hydrolase